MKPIEQLSDDELADLVRRAAALPEAPAEWQRRALALWQGQASRLPALLRRVAAVLSFDSRAAAPLAAGLRGAAAETRHLLYSASGRDVDLRVSPDAGRWVLAGQILGPDAQGVVELAAEGAPAGDAGPMHLTTLDTLGEFRIQGIAPGRYRLRLRLDDVEIELPPLEVGA